ncbi:MAG: peptidoglycan DD-metalloendopeptidase family protein [Methylobacter sp.]|nr:peptidoglycan DD-metalloendopeptidase family protein [Methylobacter sp.]
MKKKIVICVLLSAFINQVSAEVSDKSKKLSEVQSDIAATRQEMQRIRQQKSTLSAQLAEIEKLYGKTATILKTLQGQVDLKRQDLNKIQQKKQAFQNEVSKQNKELAGQIRAAHAMGQQEKLKLLLNQQDPALSSRMMVYYDYLNRARAKKLASIEESMQHLELLGKQEQEETQLLEKNLEQKKLEQMAVDSVREQRAQLLAQLSNDFSWNEKQIDRLKESESKLKDLISSLQQSTDDVASETVQEMELPKVEDDLEAKDDSTKDKNDFPELKGDFSSLKGQLPWPIKGRVANRFGSARAEGTWEGVLIDAKEGAEIRAVNRGKVVYADWLRGYGLLTIIDHGKGYMTLYAFNQSLYKKIDERVEAGDVIASVGQSDGRSQPGLYFEIRKKGKPIDPLEWCRK